MIVDAETEESEERDTLLDVEMAGMEHDPRPIIMHIGPRTPDVVSVSLAPDEAWRLARALARAATEAEAL